MKKLLSLLLILSFSFGDVFTTIKNIIGEEKYQTYKELIQSTFKDQNSTLEEIITILEENGLIDLFFQSPQTITPTFIFKNNNPIFNTHTLYKTLDRLGYYYFYPKKVSTYGNYSITIEMKSTHHIDPLSFVQEIRNYGCEVIDIKNRGDYIYTIDCENERVNAYRLKDKTKSLINAKGEYWIDTNNFSKISIKSSKLDSWYPYVVMYDKNLNIINLIAKRNIQKTLILNIPNECKYIKIRDNFTKENIKRGIFVKGLKWTTLRELKDFQTIFLQ